MPLKGRRVLVTRARDQAAALCDLLSGAGAVPVLLPAIAVEAAEDLLPLDRAMERLWLGGWLAFTSANAVTIVLERRSRRKSGAFDAEHLAAMPAGVRVAAVGPATAKALQARGVHIDAMPAEHIGAALAGALGDLAGKVVVLPGSDIARDETAEALRAAGALVERVTVYRTSSAEPDAQGKAELGRGVDAVTFTSPSTVRGLMERLEPPLVQKVREAVVACIGPTTAAAARAAGLEVAVHPHEHTIEALVNALAEHFKPIGPAQGPRSLHQAVA